MFALQDVVKSIKSFTFELAFKVIIKLAHLGLAHLDCLNKVTNIDISPLGIFDQHGNELQKWQDAMETKNQLNV
jgi:hypothetical protein